MRLFQFRLVAVCITSKELSVPISDFFYVSGTIRCRCLLLVLIHCL